jgi:hypothetical protein
MEVGHKVDSELFSPARFASGRIESIMLALKAANFRMLATNFMKQGGAQNKRRAERASLMAEVFQAAADNRSIKDLPSIDEGSRHDPEAVGAHIRGFEAKAQKLKRDSAVKE